MLVIRLFRTGKKHQPFYKIVLTDKRKPPKGGLFIEQLGFLNPITKQRKINGERAKYWISKGAQPSVTVYNLLISEKVLEGKKIPVRGKSKKKEAEKPVQEVKKEPEIPAEKPIEEKPVESPKEEIKEESKPIEVEKPAEEPKTE